MDGQPLKGFQTENNMVPYMFCKDLPGCCVEPDLEAGGKLEEGCVNPA